MIINKNEAKVMTKQISCDSKFQFQFSNIIIHSIGQNKKTLMH